MTGSSPPPPTARCWTLHAVGGPVDVEVRAAEDAELGLVRAALAAAGLPAGPVFCGPHQLPDTVPLHDPRLRHGAQLGAGRAAPGHRVEGALEVQVCAGPGAGRVHPVPHGPLVVGRGSGGRAGGVLLPDPEVSRAHLEVVVGRAGVAVRDLGSANGTRWQTAGGVGSEVGTEPEPWPPGALVRLGSTSLRLAVPGGPAHPGVPVPGGRLQLQPGSRPLAPAASEVVVAVPEDPTEPPRRAPAWIAVLVPAVAGGVLALVLSSPHFLLFALLGPLVAAGTWVSDRWTGRRGHRQRRAEHAAAVAVADAEVSAALTAEVGRADVAAPDPAVLAAAARRRTAPLWSGTPGPGLTVRLGLGAGPTGVTRGAGNPVVAMLLPVTVDLAKAGLHLRGPRTTVLAVARAVVCQLAALHPPGALVLTIVAGSPHRAAWGWTRWLPHTGPPAPPAGHGAPWHLVVVDSGADEPGGGWLCRARAAGAVVVQVGPGAAAAPGAVDLQVVGETGGQARLTRPGHPDRVVDLDLVGVDVATQLALDLAPLTVAGGPGGIPSQVRWRDLVPGGPPRWSRSRAHLTTVLGAGGDGPVELDLCRDGPHGLVAGTTGAGKSELLRTLVLGLARAHPPDRCSFLLVDYKGGAAFAGVADLPHTVGLLTDLDGPATGRALRSLGAELSRRERLLAEHGARELADLPDHVLLPRLVIVVDEFATLGDELPDFVPGLVGIAQRGRSLGVHLVLATQRPSGSVSPEIRANCTVRVCLRTTDEAGSRDVLGVPDAAWLPVDRPGRALLRVGPGDPVLLQVARVGVAAAGPGSTPDGTPDAAGVVVRRWTRPWARPDPGDPATAPAGAVTDLAHEVAQLRAAAAQPPGVPAPPRPWTPPLPDRVALLEPGPAHPAHVLAWGLADHPDRQRQEPLLVDLARGGGWLVVGGPGSGRTTALQTALAAASSRLSPDQLHVHVVDHAGGDLGHAAVGLPHTGTTVHRGDGHRLRRLLERLQAEVDRRRLAPGPHAHLLLLVDGLDAVADALEDVAPGGGAAALLRVLREGAAVGLTAVLSADRVLPGSRLAGAAAHRLVLPLPDLADYPVAGVPVGRVPRHRPPGRALLGPDAVEVQLALPGDLPAPGRCRVPGRVEVVELTADPPSPASPPGELVVALGPGGDDGAPVAVDLRRCGGLLVAGPAGSGRSATLTAVGHRLAGAGTATLTVAPGTPAEAVTAWVAGLGGSPGVVLADDLGRLPDLLLDTLAAVVGPGGPAVLVAAATPADVAAAFRGPGPALRRTRTALLLCPARGDAELLGLRLPRERLPTRPGSGWWVTPDGVVRVQVSRR
ncbi:FtsK/SpoIIIE domain-containing protein [Klenkia sp. LSe6-5]|uniref:FtsK/SpoIIIE domain-containing protein n=1 Tax=Klenkia sesuvii TaxID=3103137 RepID=A0ABU8DTP5_9ACTN